MNGIRRFSPWSFRAPLAALIAVVLGAGTAGAQHILVPMDEAQQNHLRAYGLTFMVLKAGDRAEWWINYRGGSFLLPDNPATRRKATLDGVTVVPIDDAAVAVARREIAQSNMDAIPLEKAPRVAIYSPPKSPPWDDAVTLALKYAGIEYTQIWDDDILGVDLAKYDWIHLFHEDFTGQFNKLYLGFRDQPWFIEQRDRDMATALKHGYTNVPALKKAVANRVRDFVEKGGFIFAMCGATETIELALAAQGVDIAAAFTDGTPMDPDADTKMDWSRTFAFQGARLEMNPGVNAMSDIDGHQVNVASRRQSLNTFSLFPFSAKFDPVGSMLVQNHRNVVSDFYGVTTSFSKARLKPSVQILGNEEGTPWVKYVHGDFGKGSWTFLGGHDPEDPQHNIGAPPTDLATRPNSPGYRLVLNNILFPAAKKKPLKDLNLAAPAARAIRTAIALAGGREVCFTCQVDAAGTVVAARAVARGDSNSVLALPGFAKRGEMMVHNHPSGNLDPSGPDLTIASKMHDEGIGFGIVDNAAERLYVVVEVPQGVVVTAIDPAATAGLLGPDGPIAAHLGRYEDRPAQREMAARVAKLYSQGGIGLIEAGTGVGKSLGYLVPALRWAAANGERTVVSTNTITLQEQLVGKDLPFLETALDDQKVRFAMLKGWRNYLCLQRLDHARTSSGSLFDDGAMADLNAISAWSARTSDGSLADLATPPRPDVWDEVAAEADLCTRLRCPHFDKCFVFKARREAAQADVVVVNHHLLMADLAVRRAAQNWTDAAVLPSYSRLVIDEGHHLEDAASSHLAATASRRGILRLLSRLERKGRGLLPALEMKLAQSNDLLSTASLDLVRIRLYGTTSAARQTAEMLFDVLDGWVARQSETQIRLTDRFDDDDIWREGLSHALDDLLRDLDALSDGLILVRDRIETDQRKADELASVLGELRGVIRRLENAGDALRFALRPGADAHQRIRWIEVRGGAPDDGDGGGRERTRHVGVASVPLDLAPILREDLFRRLETCVVTSATLSVGSEGDGFEFITKRLGLDEDDVEPVTAALESPFDFASQAVLAIPTDVPVPGSGDGGHIDRTVEIAADLVRAARGGVFLLFTSHRDVREAARVLRDKDLDRDYMLLVHGEDSRDSLLRRFRAHGDAVLIGTASFWEGVDVPGRALRGLLLARIPFRVPSEPITAAHCEAIEAAGGDAFMNYMVPHAALRLKQGFGRLIRSTTDRGAVVICDPRVIRKSYGAALLAGLPPARRLDGTWASIRPKLEDFYRETDSGLRG